MEKQIKELIESKRPNLSPSSVKTYGSILKSIYYMAFDSDTFKASNFDNIPAVMKALKDVNPKTRKTYLSALFIITEEPAYKNQMIDDIDDYNDDENKQEKTDKQKDNWVEGSDIKTLFNELEMNNKHLYKKKNLTNIDYQQLQNYIILALLGGVFIPPRRSKDYVDFVIIDPNTDEDNYLKGNKMFFNSYKTAKFYGQQVVDIPPALSKILKRWVKINPTKYLLFDSNQNKLSNVKLNQRLNKLFGKKAGINQMRKTFLTEKYGETSKQIEALKNTMKEMGSSIAQQKIYIKPN